MESLELWESYVQKVARRYKKISPILSEEDIAQEASIVILKCYRRFPSLPETEFGHMVKRSIKNRMIDLLRFSRRHGDQMSLQVDVSQLCIPTSAFDSFFIETAIQQMKDQLSADSARVLCAVIKSESRKEAVKQSGLKRSEFYIILNNLKTEILNSVHKPYVEYNLIEANLLENA